MLPQVVFFKLEKEFKTLFSKEDLELIDSVYKPMGFSENRKITSLPYSRPDFLASLATWFKKSDYYHIAWKIAHLAISHREEETNLIKKHFYYHNLITVLNANKRAKTSEQIDESVKLIEKYSLEMTSISNTVLAEIQKDEAFRDGPRLSHTGYEYLINIYISRNQMDHAIELAHKAEKEGWNVDSESVRQTVEKANKKKNKLKT